VDLSQLLEAGKFLVNEPEVQAALVLWCVVEIRILRRQVTQARALVDLADRRLDILQDKGSPRV
jgi:hypothetical protein